MIRTRAILITGVNGEIGHGLVMAVKDQHNEDIIGLDVEEVDRSLKASLLENITGNILDQNSLDHINSRFELTAIYHLAALLSTRAEFSPRTAHQVNVDGTFNLLALAVDQSRSQGRPVKFFFPSSIAVYGLANLKEKNKAGQLSEKQYLFPQTMYGCNKLYCELLGTYYAEHYERLAADAGALRVDFRSLRFPGLISAVTLPVGGSSDYAPEMLHAAAQGQPYDCFVREDTALPFMTMPDAIRAALMLMDAPREALTRRVYNIGAFAPTAGQLRQRVLKDFPKAEITFTVDENRQPMVDSWPSDVDDAAARKDWGWQPQHNFEDAFAYYLIPHLRNRYGI